MNFAAWGTLSAQFAPVLIKRHTCICAFNLAFSGPFELGRGLHVITENGSTGTRVLFSRQYSTPKNNKGVLTWGVIMAYYCTGRHEHPIYDKYNTKIFIFYNASILTVVWFFFHQYRITKLNDSHSKLTMYFPVMTHLRYFTVRAQKLSGLVAAIRCVTEITTIVRCVTDNKNSRVPADWVLEVW